MPWSSKCCLRTELSLQHNSSPLHKTLGITQIRLEDKRLQLLIIWTFPLSIGPYSYAWDFHSTKCIFSMEVLVVLYFFFFLCLLLNHICIRIAVLQVDFTSIPVLLWIFLLLMLSFFSFDMMSFFLLSHVLCLFDFPKNVVLVWKSLFHLTSLSYQSQMPNLVCSKLRLNQFLEVQELEDG